MFSRYSRNAVLFCLLISLIGGLFFPPGPVFAASFTVNSTDDGVDATPGDGVCATGSGQCTLRAAIMETNALGGDNTITLPAGAYTLNIAGRGEEAAAEGDLDITNGTLTIMGAGNSGETVTSIVDGGSLDRVFDIRTGTTVTLRRIAIMHGDDRDTPDQFTFDQGQGGGGLRAWEAAVTLDQVVVQQNSTVSHGGGVSFNVMPTGAKPIQTTRSVTSSTFQHNTAKINGGGLAVANGVTLNLNSSAIISNTAQAQSTQNLSRYGGGGLFVGQGYTPIGGEYKDTKVNIVATNFDDNFTSDNNGGLISGSAWGGAIHLEKSTVTISGNSTFTANKAEGDWGGAIFADGAALTVAAATFDSNISLEEGGAIYAQSVPLVTIDSSTFVNNQAPASVLGGGGAVSGSGQLNNGSFSVTNSIFKNNRTAGSGGALKIGANSTVSNVEVSANQAGSNGGGIVVSGSTSDAPTIISNATISGNVADVRGGGIENGAVLQLSDSIIRNNMTNQSEGGGVSNYESFSLAIDNTDIVNNYAASNGGGIFDRHGTFGANGNDPHTSLFTNLFIDGNQAAGDGGGVYSVVSVKIANSTISNNTAQVSGGGILTYSNFDRNSQRTLYPVQLDLTNATLTGNSAQEGGAIYQNGGVSKLNNVTIASNTALTVTTGGGGVYQDSSNPGDLLNPNTITVQNTIIAKNTASTGPDCANTVLSAGHNLIGDNTGCTIAAATGDQIGISASQIDPLLATLALNGGATKTLALLAGSPAIDAGDAGTCTTADQRNAPRVNTCDIGAFEFGSTPPTPTPVPTQTPIPTQTPTPTQTSQAPDATVTPTPTATSLPETSTGGVYLPIVKR